MPQQHIAIAGAGLLGRLLAWQLLEQGHQITLFEAGSFKQPRCAAYTAAAMISPLSEVVVSERKIYDMGMESLSLWPRWIDQLNNGLSTKNNDTIQFSATGSLVVAHPQDLSELRQFKQDLTARLGLDDNSEWLDQKQLDKKESALNHFQQGLWLPQEAYLDNRLLLEYLLVRIQQLGGQCYDNSPVAIENNEIDFQPKKNTFDRIIDCRGIGAKQSIKTKNLRGVRGEVLWVETREIQLQHAVRLMHPRYKLYIVPKPNHQFIIGATEIESEDLSPISLQSNLELASALYTVNPAFAEARVIETDVNLRPAFSDNLPDVIENDRVIQVNGLYRHGYLLAPVVTQQVLSLVNENSTNANWEYHSAVS